MSVVASFFGRALGLVVVWLIVTSIGFGFASLVLPRGAEAPAGWLLGAAAVAWTWRWWHRKGRKLDADDAVTDDAAVTEAATTENWRGFGRRAATRAAGDTAFAVVKDGRSVISNGRRDAVWRARADGVIEVARAHWGHVELHEVYGDGTSRLIQASRRSWRQVAAIGCFWATALSLVLGVVLGFALVRGIAIDLMGVSMFVLFPATMLLSGRSNVRPWVRERFGADDDWAQVPWSIDGKPTTGTQDVVLTKLLDDRDGSYRVTDDGSLEVVLRRKEMEVHRIAPDGTLTHVETQPKWFDLKQLRGAETTWHRVLARDPTD